MRDLRGAGWRMTPLVWRVTIAAVLVAAVLFLFWDLSQGMPSAAYFLLIGLVVALLAMRTLVQRLLERHGLIRSRVTRVLDFVYFAFVGLASYLFTAYVFPGSR